MTTIVAVEYEDHVVISADSRVSSGSTYEEGMTKVIFNGNLTFAVSGALLTLQNLQYADLPEPHEHEWDFDKYVATELIPAIASVCDPDTLPHSTILAVVAGRVYSLDQGTWFRSKDGVYAIGSGSAFAYGALSAGAPEDEAVHIAGLYDKGTGGEVTTWVV